MAGTKQIHDARVVVLRLDGVDPAMAADNLKRLGMVHAVALTDPRDLSDHIAAGRVDVVVVSVAAPVPVPVRDPQAAPGSGLLRPPDAALKAGIPCLLLIPSFTRAVGRAAMALGYAAAMSADVAPRLVYRRVGALMQRVRRSGRARSAAREHA
ncbi:hypothetical protein [Phreatobacter sp.]|uniref:hypothetical protein n=1 Tax=Phreatobacter sp. TaxID=1966341 RepID=UPI0025D18C51|nr:hypothetical protein [Phreatobacter sp.]